MSSDPYRLCPGGTGKKVKFCCPDLTGELDKLERMVESEQRAGALDQVEALLKKHPDRACLLNFKAVLEGVLKGPQAAQATLARYIELYPGNPVALAEMALRDLAAPAGPQQAVNGLQRALEAVGDQDLPQQVYSVIGAIAQALLRGGYVLAGRGHYLLQLGFSQGQDDEVVAIIAKIQASPGIPLLMKQEVSLVDPPADAAWKKAFDATLDFAYRGCWLKAAASLEELAGKVGRAAAILRNLAVLRGWLADEPGAIRALREYAAAPGVELDDAIEAEALAQLIDPESFDRTEIVRLRYAVANFESLQARLFAHPQTPRMPFDLNQMGGESQPAPKGAYFVLDRPVPPSAANMTRDLAPRIVGQALLFSRETDRDARLELIVYQGPEHEAAVRTLALVSGDALGAEQERTVVDAVPATQHLLSWNWRLPDDTSAEQRLELMAAERRDALLERWPLAPIKALGGKTPLEATSDPALRIPLLAAILLIELSGDTELGAFDFNELRARLGLPLAGPVDPTQFNRLEAPLARLGRIDLTKLDDAALVESFDRAQHLRHVAALRRFAQEIVRRPNYKGDVRAAAHGVLAQTELDSGRAIEQVLLARKAAESAGLSTVPWDLTELSLQLVRGDIAEADRLLRHIRADHMGEPGVAEALFRLLVEHGILGPDGQPVARPTAPSGPELVVPGSGPAPAPAAASKLWTPGSEPAPTGKRSALWTPGS